MITSILIELSSFFLVIIKFIIPNWFIPEELIDSIIFFQEQALNFNGILPIATLLFCIYLILTFASIMIMYKIATSFMTIIRGGGSPANLEGSGYSNLPRKLR